MAMDGSFSLQLSFDRFLSRCSKLQNVPKLVSLRNKGHLVTEAEVVGSLAELFLHPSYTIPLIGCFRPIADQIIKKAIGILQCVPDLRSDAEGDENLDEIVDIVEFIVWRGSGLYLHELACLAFCRALDMAPFLLSSVLFYFKFAPPPFERLLTRQAVFEMSSKVRTCAVCAAQISYRLLMREPEFFSKLWDWSCFLDLMKQLSNLHLDSVPEGLKDVVADLRWCGVQILSTVLRMSYGAASTLHLEAEEALKCLLRWEEFCQDISLEKASWYLESSEQKEIDPDRSTSLNVDSCLLSFVRDSQAISSVQHHEIERPLRCQKIATKVEMSVGKPFVLTISVKSSFERAILAVSQKLPVLLYGPIGCGKSALITKLAQETRNEVLSIQMDDQIDGRTLVGAYVCAEKPGEFRWQPGSLMQAVQNGLWIVFEDIDRAPSDVHSILLPLLEGARTFVSWHGENIRVSENFRLFATIRTSTLDASHNPGGGSLSVLWRRVMVGPPNDDDLRKIVKAWYPNLEDLALPLIETLSRVNSICLHQPLGFHSANTDLVNSLNRFSLRDLLKFCKRIANLGFSYGGCGLSDEQRYCIYREAVDLFAASSASNEDRLAIIKEISKLWSVTDKSDNRPVFQNSFADLRIGRASLHHFKTNQSHGNHKPFVRIRSSLCVLERIACSVKNNEPVLLVGETGTGKTTLVQILASLLGQKLTVLNLSQQSDVADLLGGFKPVDAQFVYFPLYKEFEDLFSQTFSVKGNHQFLACLRKDLSNKRWKMLLDGFKRVVEFFWKSVEQQKSGSAKKRKKPLEEKIEAWEKFNRKLESAHAQSEASSGMVFSFVEGSFVTSIRNGEWILLDEVNLAPAETLQRISGVLEGENGSLCLAERGDMSCITRNSNFRVFACMNPATDAGKSDLPISIRSRFTEYFVDDVLDNADLTCFVDEFISSCASGQELVGKIVGFYKAAKEESEVLQDGANQKPQYSLRSLYRALEYVRKAERDFGFQKALYDGFSMFFLTLLDGPSAKIMNEKILSILLEGRMPLHVPFDRYLTFKSNASLGTYVLTKSVKQHLGNLARAILMKKYPVLLQGPTSSGKTSLVHYLAAMTGHEFVRINNHEHTDLQEYLGLYLTDANGKLVFQEGALVKAVRNGYWIVLDELNLAPSDVLEALNRLLDDNRELFVPELQVTVQPHPDFMLFATQNPPTLYGGRKILSRAFRNRFVEIHVGEIPEEELSIILEKRCEIPESHAKKMVAIMKDLQLQRQKSKVFAGKHGFITPRDLFRWADRFRKFGKSYEDLARDGYYLLAERLRDEDEKCVVQEVLERRLRVKLTRNNLYDQVGDSCSSLPFGYSESIGSVIMTKNMWRLYFLVRRCFELREPVLLVGETGCGKTTVCQLLSSCLKLNLHILNCHQYTETSDFLGGFRPVRERSKLISNYKDVIEQLKKTKAFQRFFAESSISSDIDQASMALDQLNSVIKKYTEGHISSPDITKDDIHAFEHIKLELDMLHHKWQTIFLWQDGPLVKAMRDGDFLLVDEISLADDSVLERLNSVLEPERKLMLAEKGGSDLETITAHFNFLVLATMNPGGDYGKKELSPALRNRFTEIWVPPLSEPDELRAIALQRISKGKFCDPVYQERNTLIVDAMLCFWQWFNEIHLGRLLTVRDIISWADFVTVTEEKLGTEYAFLHGLFLVLLDGISLGTGLSKKDATELREQCLFFLLEKLKVDKTNILCTRLLKMENYGWGDIGGTENIPGGENVLSDSFFGIDPFYIRKGSLNCETGGFEFLAPTTRRNALRVLRAMQLLKPVLLEGSPGVGKTSLIVALGKFSGHRVVRINLSEQTDMMDLLGSDLPVESEEGIKFSWSDGILLQALKEGCWVLLDELNLAPQSVLEGLNAILDHRAEVFIPELGQTYKCPPSFRVFACQNPSHQGGGRKGLPKSFLNRFVKVYVDELAENDHLFICRSLYPSIPEHFLSKIISFNKRMHEETMLLRKFGQDGSPWEFNLRDVFRSCQMIQGDPESLTQSSFLNILYIQRMRTAADRREVLRLYEEVFRVKPWINPYPRVQLSSQNLIVGNTAVKRNTFQSCFPSNDVLKILPGIRQILEAAAECVRRQWLCILVGPSSSGKTSVIRLLSNLTGNVLNEINLSSATDISELLGSFEQYDAARKFRSVVSEVEQYVYEYCSLRLELSGTEFINERQYLISRWSAFLSSMGCDDTSVSASFYVENRERIVDTFSLLIEVVEQLKLDWDKMAHRFSQSISALDTVMKTIFCLRDCMKRVVSTKFEWVTGLLINALEKGEWIVLENANLCNPTVLDRINSLVEPSGSITVNERGNVDGNPLVISPHPNFRMFLTVNPDHGEVSRAMRNRGVEIFMMQPYWAFDDSNGYNSEEIEVNDIKRYLILSGVPVANLVDAMARAHIYAMNEGLRYNIRISYHDLSCWVQLFQRLLMEGNQPIWSLQVSWEHTYFSSLGEVDGGRIINIAKVDYLSFATKFSEPKISLACSLCLPGGWPMPLKMRDYICYSREASVAQNCMYVQFLGAQSASYGFEIAQNRWSKDQFSVESTYGKTYMMNIRALCQTICPNSDNVNLDYARDIAHNLELTNKMLLYAANWTIEQATQNDLKLYLLWFDWFRSKLQPFSQVFNDFLLSLEQLIDHPLWNYLVCRHNELASLFHIDFDLQHLPLLSSKLVDLVASNKLVKSCKFLSNSVTSIGAARLTYQQWNTQRHNVLSNEARDYLPLLGLLQLLEKTILNKLVDPSFMLVESPSFDNFIDLYSNLVEGHIQFWGSIASSRFELVLLSWRSLIKDAKRLSRFCPEAVHDFLEESKSAGIISHSEKSLLWIHGGHPNMPPTSDLYHKQGQLSGLVELIWPTMGGFCREGPEDDHRIEVIASSNVELRSLATQGLSMSSLIMEKCGHDEDDTCVAQQLDDMYQMLLRRFKHEIQNLQLTKASNDLSILEQYITGCCSFTTNTLCGESMFDCWMVTFIPINHSSLFRDLDLLLELSSMPLDDPKYLQQKKGHVSSRLGSAMDFSLNFSSRPPQMFLPHQKLMWVLDASASLDSVTDKIASSVLEMWYKWHQSLWTVCPEFVKTFSKIDIYDVYDIPLPMLTQPVNIATVLHIMQQRPSIKDFFVHHQTCRVTSYNLWSSSYMEMHLPSILLSAAKYIFVQIVYSLRKSFDAEKFTQIKSVLCSLQQNISTEESVKYLCALIESSKHQRLKGSVHMLIMPLIRELYLDHTANDDFDYNLGLAWFRIGELRFRLLLCADDIDPALKYSCKYTHIIEKISSIELEIQVRRECKYLSGHFSSRQADKKTGELEYLRAERRKMQKKIVFRPEPGKFRKLKNECNEFLGEKVVSLVKSVKGMVRNCGAPTDLQYFANQVLNWQETATQFIDRLTHEYASYMDIIQPIQVAVYEMKLGLSLVLSVAFHKFCFGRVGLESVDLIMETIYNLMKYPRGSTFKSISVIYNGENHTFPSHPKNSNKEICSVDIILLEKLISISAGVGADRMVSVTQLRASVNLNNLVRVLESISNAKLMDYESLLILDKIFYDFASLWMNMKVHSKAKSDIDAQQFKFKPRNFQIESFIEVDISTLVKANIPDIFLDWKEFLSEEESLEKKEAVDELEASGEEWNVLDESILSNVVCVHSQLFGSHDLIHDPGTLHFSDSERLQSFIDSYTLGISLMKGLGIPGLSRLDAKLMPEHVLHLCLESEHKFLSSHKSAVRYNFYKHSNASEMAGMVKSLIPLQQKIDSLLCERQEHHDLQKVSDLVSMLLDIPLTTPLAKVLSGLQFLLNRVHVMQENGSKFPLSDLLEPVVNLVSLWRKIELNSWPALLDEVLDECERNAEKFWFPLYSVLQHKLDNDEYDQTTIISLEDFIQLSNVGEFKRRLQLLFAFLGQANMSRCLKNQSSSGEINELSSLYNIFGFYIQYLPIVLEHISANRRKVDKELQEVMKLCRWEQSYCFLSAENSKKTRQKLKKLIQKYTDTLQQPVALILNQEAVPKGTTHSLPSLKECSKTSDNDMLLFSDGDRSLWFENCCKKLENALKSLQLKTLPVLDALSLELNYDGDVSSTIRSSSDCTHLSPQKAWEAVWRKVEDLYRTAVECGDCWKEEKKMQVKRRIFSDLLKQLEIGGFSRHISTHGEDELKTWWFLQPSVNLQYLLPTQAPLPSGTPEPASDVEMNNSRRGLDAKWRIANEHYFKSVASVLSLQQSCLNPHKDITREQVDRSRSFLTQLIQMEQKQLNAANHFDTQLKCFGDYVSTLENLNMSSSFSDDRTSYECSIASKQRATTKCMWQQKQLFDSLCAISQEELLLLKTFQNNHTCQTVRAPVSKMIASIEEFLPLFCKSKESLEDYLIGRQRAIIVVSCSSHPFIVSKQMEQLVLQNFSAIRAFQEVLRSLREQLDRNSVQEILIGHFEEVIKMGILIEEEFNSEVKATNRPVVGSLDEEKFCSIDCSALNIEFDEALVAAFQNIRHILQKFGFFSNNHGILESLLDITSWESIFNSFAADLSFHHLCENLLKLFISGAKLVNHSGNNLSSSRSSEIGVCFRHLHVFSSLVLDFGMEILKNFLAMNRAVSIVSQELASNLSYLYSKGFGTSENQEGEGDPNAYQDSTGTGMGEGVGVQDVSNQITDEDQLLGTNEQTKEKQDASGEVPSNKEKGIEMEQDFEADAFSLSEDSGEDDNPDADDEDEQLESAMGEAGDYGEVVDEKLWDKEEDGETPHDTEEKHESVSSVGDRDKSSLELRAKDDTALDADESLENNDEEVGEQNDEIGVEEDTADKEEMEGMTMNKDASFSDPTDMNLDEKDGNPDKYTELEEKKDDDLMEEADPEEQDEAAQNANDEEERCSAENENDEVEQCTNGDDKDKCSPDGIMGEPNAEQADETPEKDDVEGDLEEKADRGQRNNASRPGAPNLVNDLGPNSDGTIHSQGNGQTSRSNHKEQEQYHFDSSNHGDPSSVESLPSSNTSEEDLMVQNLTDAGQFTQSGSKKGFAKEESPFVQKNQPNPYRSVGNAFEEWKERAKVSVDLETGDMEPFDAVEVDNADEYGFVPEHEKGISQAMGPATSEQVDKNADSSMLDKDGRSGQKDDMEEMHHFEKQNSEVHTSGSSVSMLKNHIEQMNLSESDKSYEDSSIEFQDVKGHDSQILKENVVSLRKCYLGESRHQLSELSLHGNVLPDAKNPTEVEVKGAMALWRKYELSTLKLSQELSEQLRLIMEPTIASKLQGDYRTGKRINMKKVIPYIASHYRKDKIWLRRTRPNKRDYQVVIAVDDSRSMSESCCGTFAIEALVTVCRAVSQLEMGDLGVASFGTKGNIKLLHEFDQPFTADAGVKMISNLTFKQENTIVDEPVVDLLKYLNHILDEAAAKARLPSGQSPLQQLVLIIADGRMNDKRDNLKRCVRDLLSSKCMVVFLILDSQQDSIIDLEDVSFNKERGLVRTKYLDSFPFPYYIVLRNIEALPRTLGELLRQWFELIQCPRD